MGELKWPHRHKPRDVGAIVENEVRRWELRSGGSGGVSPEGWPVVSISREFGTLGLALGRRVARRLGFSCWDREFVSEIARRLHQPKATISAFDERAHTAIDDLFGVTFEQDVLTADYGDQLRAIVRSVMRQGGAVIIGRGSQFLVDPQRALRVRLVAPYALRVREVATRTHLSNEEAAERVRARDRDRAEFMRQHFGKDGTDPNDYDLTINTAVYTPRRADSLVLMAYLAKFGGLPLRVRSEESSQRVPASQPLVELPVTD
jgi:hypothetical protein